MNKFVLALLWLLGGLLAGVVLALPLDARPQASPQEPIPYPIWSIEEVATGGYLNALALDSLDRPHLLYQDTQTWAVHYATREGYGDSPGTWQLEDIITTPGDAASYSYDIAIRPYDTPCLVYAIVPSVLPLDTKLVYGCRGPEGWQLDVIDDGGNGARLVFDPAGRPHIALTRGESLVYLTWQDGHWRGDTVATFTNNINLTSLGITGNGRPHVVYSGSDGTFAAVLETNGVWTKTPILTAGITATRLGPGDNVWGVVVYTHDPGGHAPLYSSELSLARPDGAGGHSLELVETGLGTLYYYRDLVMVGDTPHLTFNGIEGQVSYHWWTDEGRQRHDLPVSADGEISLALGSDGQPRIAFASGGQLKLATRRMILFDEAVYLPGVVGP